MLDSGGRRVDSNDCLGSSGFHYSVDRVNNNCSLEAPHTCDQRNLYEPLIMDNRQCSCNHSDVPPRLPTTPRPPFPVINFFNQNPQYGRPASYEYNQKPAPPPPRRNCSMRTGSKPTLITEVSKDCGLVPSSPSSRPIDGYFSDDSSLNADIWRPKRKWFRRSGVVTVVWMLLSCLVPICLAFCFIQPVWFINERSSSKCLALAWSLSAPKITNKNRVLVIFTAEQI